MASQVPSLSSEHKWNLEAHGADYWTTIIRRLFAQRIVPGLWLVLNSPHANQPAFTSLLRVLTEQPSVLVRYLALEVESQLKSHSLDRLYDMNILAGMMRANPQTSSSTNVPQRQSGNNYLWAPEPTRTIDGWRHACTTMDLSLALKLAQTGARLSSWNLKQACLRMTNFVAIEYEEDPQSVHAHQRFLYLALFQHSQGGRFVPVDFWASEGGGGDRLAALCSVYARHQCDLVHVLAFHCNWPNPIAKLMVDYICPQVFER